jgi:hypothetical protein
VSGDGAEQNQKNKSAAGRVALIGFGATALAIINIATGNGEAQPQAVVILEYAALAGGVVALVGGLIMLAARN